MLLFIKCKEILLHEPRIERTKGFFYLFNKWKYHKEDSVNNNIY